MPIYYYIDHARHLVVARGVGVFTSDDMFAYQQEVWTQPEVAGYDELVDMTEVEQIAPPREPGAEMRTLARTAAAQDDRGRETRFAIVAPGTLAYGLGRQYQTHRELQPRSKKEVGVFQTLSEALAFLGIESLDAAVTLNAVRAGGGER